jgi:AraC-like DNA-binding protein
MACLSEAQFYASFKKQTGQSPGQMITQKCMQRAYEQLLAGPVSIQALSEQCGYQNYESFSRVFKSSFGLSPDDLAQVVDHIKSRQSEIEGGVCDEG